MAKILSDSVIPSKANAPLDARTEVDSLDKVGMIENPTESLIIYDKDTKKHYKVSSMKDVPVEGTTLNKKVIESVEPMVADGGTIDFEEVGDTDFDDIFDQMDIEAEVVGDAPEVDFDSLQ